MTFHGFSGLVGEGLPEKVHAPSTAACHGSDQFFRVRRAIMRTLHLPPVNEIFEALVLYVIVVPIVVACIITAVIFITE
ncbi:MAG: hypothetical protein WB402_01985 [Sulfuricaulis sp.]|uniref:hypothetical protein n=1 Tax=Sulfuricaulis sp. TaxID=2003553 RepID=UPI003C475D63